MAERLKCEEDARKAEQEKSDERSRYRMRMASLTDEDRRTRADWFEKNRKPKAPSEASSNLITKFYKRVPHASHELRVRNDKVRDTIIDKWQLASPK